MSVIRRHSKILYQIDHDMFVILNGRGTYLGFAKWLKFEGLLLLYKRMEYHKTITNAWSNYDLESITDMIRDSDNWEDEDDA